MRAALLAVLSFALFGVALAKLNPIALGKINVTVPNDDYSFGAVLLVRANAFVLAVVDYTSFASASVNSTLYSFDVRGNTPKLVNSISLPKPGPTSLFAYNGGAGVYAVVQDNIPQTPVIVDISVNAAGFMTLDRRISLPDELSDKIVIFGQTDRPADHLYLIDRNIWILDRTAWRIIKGPALEFPSNSNLFSGDLNWSDRTAAVSGYQMCLTGDRNCDPNMGAWSLYRFNTSTGRVIRTIRLDGTEWALLTDTATNNGLRIQDVKGSSINVMPFDYAQFKAGNALPDSSSRPFMFNQRLTFARLGKCLYYAWADAKSTETDKVRVTQLALGADGTTPPRVIEQQTLNIETTFSNFFVPWITAANARLFVAAKNTLFVHDASCGV